MPVHTPSTGIISSRIVLGLLKPMLYVAGISLAVCSYHSLADAAILTRLAPWVRAVLLPLVLLLWDSGL